MRELTRLLALLTISACAGGAVEQGKRCDQVGQTSCSSDDRAVLQCVGKRWQVETECVDSREEECVNQATGAFCSIFGETCDTEGELRCSALGFDEAVESCDGRGWQVDRQCAPGEICSSNGFGEIMCFQ